MEAFAFGGQERERLEVAIAGYERTPTGDYYDDNWLTADISVHCGAFQGRFAAALLTHELQTFHDQLEVLYQSLSGNAAFSTLEGQLALSVTGDGRGHLRITGEATDQPGSPQRLAFEIAIDQTQLRQSLHGLAAVLEAYPVRG